MTIIDLHTHIFPDPVAGAAMAALTAESPVAPLFDGTLAGLLAAMDEGGIERAGIQPVATKPSAVGPVNDWVASLDRARIVPFGAMHPDLAAPDAEIARMAAFGLVGFKMHPEFQRFRPDDFERMAPIYTAAIEHGLVVYFHAGLDLAIPTCHSTPERFAHVLDEFPDLTAVLAHLGGWKQWDEVQTHLVGRDVYLDTSFALGYLDESRFLEIVGTHGSRRIVFGSDAPAVLDDILWRSATALLDSRPRH